MNLFSFDLLLGGFGKVLKQRTRHKKAKQGAILHVVLHHT